MPVKTPILSFGSLCPGKKYAITQAKWFLLSLVHTFDIELCEGEKTELDVHYHGHEILPPTNEVQMRYRLRKDHENLIFVWDSSWLYRPHCQYCYLFKLTNEVFFSNVLPACVLICALVRWVREVRFWNIYTWYKLWIIGPILISVHAWRESVIYYKMSCEMIRLCQFTEFVRIVCVASKLRVIVQNRDHAIFICTQNLVITMNQI